jgi:ribosomal-protein-alanine N-acetyltransferase
MILLETERLLFRDHTLEDLDPFCALEADPAVRRFVGGRHRTREEAEHRFRNGFLKARNRFQGLPDIGAVYSPARYERWRS